MGLVLTEVLAFSVLYPPVVVVVSVTVVVGVDGFVPEVLELTLAGVVVDEAEAFIVVLRRTEAVEKKGVVLRLPVEDG